MSVAFQGESITQDDIARWLGTSEIGTPASRVEQLSKRGFEVIYRQGSLGEVRSWLARATPCILFVRTGELAYWDYDTPHAVVLVGLEEDVAFLLDPADERVPVEVPLGDLMLAWSHLGYTYAVIR
jgi:hypothetical protein